MHVTHLQLVDFRSYPALELTLPPGVVTFVGANGQGKTNLLEAIGYLATLGSHRVSTDAPLIREGAERAVIRSRVVRGDRAALAEIEIVTGRANRVRLNRRQLPRPRDLLGLLSVVLFAPEDLAMVKGDPTERRRFLDDLLVARTPRLAGVISDYERVLRQRTTLLRGRGDLRTLDSWDEALARHGAELLAARLGLVDELRPLVAAAYTAVAGSGDLASPTPPAPVGLDYRSSVSPPEGADREALAAAMLSQLAALRPREVERGVTLAGPHRDELMLSISGRAARGYASHGESWSLALALRLASFELLVADDREPVLLLDDVFAELDTHRRRRLAELVAPAEQVLITAAVGADVPAELGGPRFVVETGEVRSVD
ncbi:DNA replication/repair protein RecF [Frankia sp. CNm7]|uniref:DNA replication and repair protein RecF n=1 Tax=Frankia nepalensis TaxID=1836974 RepID=A0A937RIH4_9ACTN|nr:DNA replication/repair protein RecF [Frankia nepalensis]MBL7496737.1 DNA replication/repair protein RecF [Frankia nepalensis]MBL7510441.1 DNA replication/repair protein RecF [Frankia nepalensis]MBL7523498.1 DNA replication/repair protein RecF [Frankia nepalensis]MBL7630965.1 DNA replication/repair protein RecF [Frankia nepalensis]